VNIFAETCQTADVVLRRVCEPMDIEPRDKLAGFRGSSTVGFGDACAARPAPSSEGQGARLMKRLIPAFALVGALALPSVAQSRTVPHCQSSQVSDLQIRYAPLHSETAYIACSIAQNVAHFEVRRLLVPGEHLKHSLKIAGQTWRYRWHISDLTPNTSETYFTARNGSTVVSFDLRGEN
jgi:hypothetical protein